MDRSTKQEPSVGRVVHFVYGDQHHAAIITVVSSRLRNAHGLDIEGQTLIVFPPMEQPYSTVAIHDATFAPATWHWPEYVPAKE